MKGRWRGFANSEMLSDDSGFVFSFESLNGTSKRIES